jgi:hypothetical protein
LKTDAGDTAQHSTMSEDLLSYLIGGAYQQSALWTALTIETRAGGGRPSPLPSDLGDGPRVAGVEIIGRLPRRRCDRSWVDALAYESCPEGGEILKHPDGIGRAQNSHSAGETDAVRSRRRGSENDRRSGVQVLPTMVFADAKYVQPNLVGMFDLFDQVAETPRRANRKASFVVGRCPPLRSSSRRLRRWAS